MAMAMAEAKKGAGFVSPNPYVGAILIKNDHVLGAGYHQKYGTPHAEVHAILNAKEKSHNIEGSTLYVNLEPCSHTNKQTPPCVPFIIKEKIKKVVIANIDPNPLVSGNGIKFLIENGVEVIVDVLKEEGEKLNEIYFKTMRYQAPFVHLKMAQTLDGKVATKLGESKYITGAEALRYAHSLRQTYDVIVVGKNTVLMDDPSLTVRLYNNAAENGPSQGSVRHPRRLIFMDLKSVDFKLKVFSDEYKEHTIIATTEDDFNLNSERAELIKDRGMQIYAFRANDEGRVRLKDFLDKMYALKLHSLLIEGGPLLASAFLKENLVDKVSMIIAPYFLGEGQSSLQNIGVQQLAQKKEIKQATYKNLGKDFLIEGYLCSQG